MSTLNPTIGKITTGVNDYFPAVLAGVQAAESVPGASGPNKLQAVVNGVLGTTGALANNSNPNVAAIAGLTSLVVGILNELGLFSHQTTA